MRIADASVGELQKELGAADEGKLRLFKESIEMFTRVRVIR